MADFARIVAAVDVVLGTHGLDHYLGKQTSLACDSLDGDPFIAALAQIDTFEGTASELLIRITPEKSPKGWPANGRAVTQRLRRQAPVMRKAGWKVSDDGGANRQNAIKWTLARPEISRNSPSHDSQARTSDPGRESASVASHEYGQSQDELGLREVDL
jgi:hypothetical protein